MLEFYLIMWGLSALGIIRFILDIIAIGLENYEKVKKNPTCVDVLSVIKVILMNFLIVPGVLLIFLQVFYSKALQSIIFELYEKNENFRRKG